MLVVVGRLVPRANWVFAAGSPFAYRRLLYTESICYLSLNDDSSSGATTASIVDSLTV